MDNSDWHQRFQVQARWTEPMRQFLYQQAQITRQSNILEVGCGTGVITAELNKLIDQPAIGIDIDFERVKEAVGSQSAFCFCADAFQLPFASQSFHLVACHFFLLWLSKPLEALFEMTRVLKPGGVLLVMAEPDHLARIDYPEDLWSLGELQTQALIRQGANPMMGRKLPELLTQAGLTEIQFGLSGFQNSPSEIPEWFDSEWNTLKHDLGNQLPLEELKRLRELDFKARQAGARVLWVPTFYAYGKKD